MAPTFEHLLFVFLLYYEAMVYTYLSYLIVKTGNVNLVATIYINEVLMSMVATGLRVYLFIIWC